MKGGRPIIIGTRGSPLAIAQATIIANTLKKKNKGSKFYIKKIKTDGDLPRNKSNSALTGKDLFTRAIDKALEEKKIDLAVHSLKDVPVETLRSNKIEIAAYPKRENPLDVLISKKSTESLETLPHNAKVGTSSIRRAIQLKSFRPDIEVIELRGNVQTRIDKLRDSDLDAILLAKAGLKRLRKNSTGNLIPSTLMLPAVGQGCLAVAVRKNDQFARRLVAKIDDQETRTAVTAERAFSKELGGGCNTPIAALATVRKGKIFLEGLMEKTTVGGSRIIVRSKITGSTRNPARLGRVLAVQLKKIPSNA